MTAAIKMPAAQSGFVGRRPNPVRVVLAGIGMGTLAVVQPLIGLSSMVVAVVWQSCRPLNWRRTLVKEFMHQCHRVGIGSLSFILLSGLLIGLAMVFQFLYWLRLAGQSDFIGQIIVMIMVREIAPLLVALIVVGRSGSVNMVELGHMRTSGQLRMLDAQGIDTFLFFVVPRCMATAISMFCLTIVFIVVALASGLMVGSVVQSSDKSVIEFLNQVLSAMSAGAYAILVLKPLIIGMLITLITCNTGLSVDGHTRQVADVLPLGFVKSVLAVFLVSGTLSVLL